MTAPQGERFALLPPSRFLVLKLASGLSEHHLLHDIADDLDLIHSTGLGADLEDELQP